MSAAAIKALEGDWQYVSERVRKKHQTWRSKSLIKILGMGSSQGNSETHDGQWLDGSMYDSKRKDDGKYAENGWERSWFLYPSQIPIKSKRGNTRKQGPRGRFLVFHGEGYLKYQKRWYMC